MLNRRVVTVFFALATISALSYAETDIETIRSMREENAHMVRYIDNYLNDRSKIPADYQAASDKEFLKKARMEKWSPHTTSSTKPTPSTTGAAKSAATAPAKSKTMTKPAAKPSPAPATKPKSGREY